MAPDGIKLPSDSTVASQRVRRNASHPLESSERTSTASQKAPPNPLATIVLQSKPLIEGRKGELFQLILQNDPKSEPPIKVVADINIKPGTPLLVELDENGQYQPVERLTRAQITKLVSLELEFWQAHLYPKAATKTEPALPSLPALQSLAKNHPELKPLVQWLTQRPSQITGQHIQQWLQEFSPLSVLRERNIAANSRAFPVNNHPLQSPTAQQTNIQSPTLSNPSQSAKFPNSQQPPNQPNSTPSTQTTEQPNQQSTANGNLAAKRGSVQTPFNLPVLTLLGKLSTAPTGSHEINLANNQSNSVDKPTTLSIRNESIASAVYRSKQLAPLLGLLPKTAATNLAQALDTVFNVKRSQPSNHSSAANSVQQPIPAIVDKPNQTIITSLPTPNQTKTESNSAFRVFRQFSNEIFTTSTQALYPNRQPEARMASELIEVKINQWLSLIEQTQTKTQNDLTSLLKSKAMALLNEGPSAADKIQIDPKVLQSQSHKEDAFSQLRNWLESAQAKVFHQAVQAASSQWQLPELPPVQQMQLPLIWLGLTSWADIEWWQEKKRTQTDKENKQPERRWRLRVYLNIEPLSEFCADIDWHTSDTQLIFWSEDSATLSHLNSLIPTLSSWTQGLSTESAIQTRHGMPKKVGKQQLQRTNHHLVDIKT